MVFIAVEDVMFLTRRLSFFVTFCLAILMVCLTTTFAQKIDPQNKGVTLPSDEKFEPASNMAIPWRWTGCHLLYPEPNCPEITNKEFRAADKVGLYENDGSLWYRFSLNRDSPEYFLKQPKAEFDPFATYPRSPNAVSLPIVAESRGWYEVEVNKKTHLTKYISKSDQEWAAVSWEYWLRWHPQIKVDFEKTPLLKTPDGAKAEGSKFLGVNQVIYMKAEGEWAYVRFYLDKQYYGWVRWRKGSEILIGCAYNNFEVPAVATSVSSK